MLTAFIEFLPHLAFLLKVLVVNSQAVRCRNSLIALFKLILLPFLKHQIQWTYFQDIGNLLQGIDF